MNIWINKCISEEPNGFEEAKVFNIAVPGTTGVISSDIRNGWYRQFGCKCISTICEDLLIIALSAFAVDKRISRSLFEDAWTRQLTVNIPVLNLERWNAVKTKLEKMLTYLSGDVWSINFREADSANRYKDPHIRQVERNSILDRIDGISLFSGGLDSFCGAHRFLKNGENTIFVGYKEYDCLKDVQEELITSLKKVYPETEAHLFRFTARANAPTFGEDIASENTSRSRSFLFLAAALSIADLVGNNVPVYIPENGFIGLNLPMIYGRIGSCSTRTTHPSFLKMLNDILIDVGIHHRIINPFAFTTKREMVREFCKEPEFTNNIYKTISCSHPRNNRWKGVIEPQNCGYCYPCLIRQSSLLDVKVPNEDYRFHAVSYDYITRATPDTKSDLVDLLSAVSTAKKSTDEQLISRIRKTGKLSADECLNFLRVYKETVSDLVELFSSDPELLRIMGLTYGTD